MGRPRSFDEAKALDAAIECFWARGFTATSMRDLSERTGLTGASLYNAFGDKRALFTRALNCYLDRSARRRVALMDASPDAAAAIRSFFDDLVAVSLKDRRGCLLVNSAMEIAPFDSELGNEIRVCLNEVRDGFARAVGRAQAEGAVRADLPAETLARVLLSAVMSIRVLARATNEAAVLRGAADAALAAIAPCGTDRVASGWTAAL